MAKSTKNQKSERQRLIEETMKKQRSADRRRGNLIVSVCVIVAVLIVGTAAYRPIKGAFDSHKYASIDLASVGAPASACMDPIERAGTGVSNHVPEGTTVDYTDAPPAFGPHWNVAGVAPAPFTEKYYGTDDRPPLEALVHNLEHGYTIMWYDQSVADNAGQLAQIKAIADKYKADDTNYRLKFIAAPWKSDDEGGKKFPNGEHVAFTHWMGDSKKSTGVWQYCSSPSGAALQSFMTKYPYTDAPEPGVI